MLNSHVFHTSVLMMDCQNFALSCSFSDLKSPKCQTPLSAFNTLCVTVFLVLEGHTLRSVDSFDLLIPKPKLLVSITEHHWLWNMPSSMHQQLMTASQSSEFSALSYLKTYLFKLLVSSRNGLSVLHIEGSYKLSVTLHYSIETLTVNTFC